MEERAPADEFGGPWGCFGIIAFSHFIVLYLYWCNQFNNGEVFIPKSFAEAGEFFFRMFNDATTHGDFWVSTKVYVSFFALQVRGFDTLTTFCGVVPGAAPVPGVFPSTAQATLLCVV